MQTSLTATLHLKTEALTTHGDLKPVLFVWSLLRQWEEHLTRAFDVWCDLMTWTFTFILFSRVKLEQITAEWMVELCLNSAESFTHQIVEFRAYVKLRAIECCWPDLARESQHMKLEKNGKDSRITNVKQTKAMDGRNFKNSLDSRHQNTRQCWRWSSIEIRCCQVNTSRRLGWAFDGKFE